MDSGIVEMVSEASDLSLQPTPIEDSSDDIEDKMLCSWIQKLHTDVDFEVQCGDDCVLFSAHKVVVSIWSPELADMVFASSDKEEENPIKITDVLPPVFDAMIKFMYGVKDQIQRQRKDMRFILNLYKAAVKYRVEHLKVTCFELLSRSTPNFENVFDVLEASIFLKSNVIEQRCYKILQSETEKVLAAQDLGNMTCDMIKTVLRLPSVSFSSEYELALWIFAWAKNKYLENDRDINCILWEVLPLLKLTSLSAEEFGKLMQNNKSCISDKDGFSIFMNIVNPGSCLLPNWCLDVNEAKRIYNFVG